MNFNAQIEIDLNKLKYNVEILKNTYNDYSVVIANIKNNFFGMGYSVIETLIKNGVNYLYVSTLQEALDIRKINTEVPILINYELSRDYIYDAIANNITITISNLNTLKDINELKLKDKLNIHLLIDNGSNKIGLKNREEVEEAQDIIANNKYLNLEGVYTEITTYGILDEDYYREMNIFLNCISALKEENVIIHLNEPIMYHKKHNLVNGIRFDLALLGIEENIDDSVLSNMKIKSIGKKYKDLAFPDIELSLVFAIKGKIININKAKKGDLIGKNFICKENMNLAILPIGHKDGITKAVGSVLINDKVCRIICDEIDYLIVEAPFDIVVGEEVYIISYDTDIYEIIGSLKTNRYYLMSILNSNLEREYINKEIGDCVL